MANPIQMNVYNRDGEATGSVEINPATIAEKINRQLLHDVVLMYLANRRAGTHSTKRRGEVAGSTKKLFRQKGTGRARVGTKRTNKRVGGGTAKGPKPRDYYYRLPKKAVRAATRMALLSRLQDHETIVVEDLAFEEIRTKNMVEVLQNLDLDAATCLVGLSATDIDEHKTIYMSARNIRGVDVCPVKDFNAYDLLKSKRVLLTKAALEELCSKLQWKDDILPEPEDEEEEEEKAEAEEKSQPAAEEEAEGEEENDEENEGEDEDEDEEDEDEKK